ncbi:hypothetical protein BABINDRAFT_74971 [Babjeviella inositovora NRRL Y-12698]|uniref:2-dehydropantolactone reductase n=1 Tax=Babjeviella inositovora NRRL Y-12698 TaxID=984486 RepID=A0A1E3QYH7_9ASCO|nr:uncharacterized protein BABINDRAFT_74971 [Babjeviella inositovora NRRL Y-12698]ODQ82678.1 hypothetical protein BABINDRAFT_74971 [Babjeviella inositovora NRRL Y-12698]
MPISKTFTLPTTGAKVPAVGFGAGTKWFKRGGASDPFDTALVQTITQAVDVGFTHIDGAEIYGTDGEIGQALAEIIKGGKSRSDLWITNKYFAGDSSYKYRSSSGTPLDAIKKQLKETGADYFDLYLLHSPWIKRESHGFSLQEAWQSLEQAQELGLAKNIGVSNFGVEPLQDILKVAKVVPQVNQIEFNAYLQNQTPGIFEFAQEHKILLSAYAPLAPLYKGPGPIDPVVAALTKKYGKSDTQVLLRWVIQKGVLPITTTSRKERLTEILGIFDFELTQEEVDEIATLGEQKKLRLYWIPDYSKYDD